MKNHLKKVIVLFVFALGTLFSGCTKDDTLKTELAANNAVVTLKSFSEVSENILFLNTFKSASSKLKRLNSGSSQKSRQFYNLEVDTLAVNEVVTDDYSTFALEIKKESENQLFYKNLVIRTNEDNETSAILLKYNLDAQKHILSIEKTTLEGNDVLLPDGTPTNENSTNRCVEVEIKFHHPCSIGSIHFPNSDGSYCSMDGSNAYDEIISFGNCGGDATTSDYYGSDLFTPINGPANPFNPKIGITAPINLTNAQKFFYSFSRVSLERQLILSLSNPANQAIVDYLNSNQNIPNVTNPVKSFITSMAGNTQTEWLTNQSPENQVSIFSYLIQNNFSNLSVAFMNQCITRMKADPIFTSIKPFLIEKGIDDSNLDPCSKAVLNALKNSQNNDVAAIIAKLGNPKSVYKTNIINENLSTAAYGSGETIWTNQTTYIPYDYTVKINTNLVAQGTQLMIYATMLHEIIHAYFLSLIDDCYASNSGCQPLRDIPYVWNQYVSFMNGNTNLSTTSISQHNQIASSYVNIIAAALQDYQPGLPAQYYTDLAWGGLHETTPYLNNDPFTRKLNSTDRARISSIQQTESLNIPQNNPNGVLTYYPKGIPCQ
jgi:hypothetical protein